jgi:hypothetical protein
MHTQTCPDCEGPHPSAIGLFHCNQGAEEGVEVRELDSNHGIDEAQNGLELREPIVCCGIHVLVCPLRGAASLASGKCAAKWAADTTAETTS